MSTYRLTRTSLKKIVTIVVASTLIVCSVPLPAAAAALFDVKTAVASAGQEGWALLWRVWERRSQTPREAAIKPLPPPTKAERALRVADIETNPSEEITLQSRQPMWFSGVPVDSTGATIQGLTVEWESANKQVIFVRKNGEAVAGNPGTTTLTAQAGNKRRTVRVTVVEGTNEPYGGTKKSSRAPNDTIPNASEIPEKSLGLRGSTRQKRAHAPATAKRSAGGYFFVREPTDDPLSDGETNSLYQPNNLVGTPPGKKKLGANSTGSAIKSSESGNKNFSFDVPVVDLAGRGLNVSMALYYNSLLYNKSTTTGGTTRLTYDVDSGYPAQGFRLSFGQIENQGSAGFTLTEANGTRRALNFVSSNTYDTIDGSFIRFIGGSGWGTLYYADGTQVNYGANGNGVRSYPTRITDRNGNYILISYLNGVGPRISTIQDTMGRYVRFYYDSNNDLVTITKPGLVGQSDIQVIRFYYETISLTTSGLFSGTIIVSGKPATARVVKYIYLPASAEGSSSSDGDCGYKFNYSPYGMIYEIVKFRGMTVSTTSTSSTGTVTEGSNTTAATTTYGYPTTAQNLTDAPTFSTRTDDWAGRTIASAPQFSFAVSEQTSETISTVTAPDNTVTENHSIKNSGAWNDGLLSEVRIQNTNPTPTVFQKTVVDWEQTPSGGPPRVASVRITNEAGKTTGTVLTYGTYNNVTAMSERDFTTNGTLGSELRRTETTYVTSTSYTNRRLLRLPSIVKTFAGGSSTPAARIDYEYDNYGSGHASLTARNDIIMHDPAWDPFVEPVEQWDWVCTEWGYNESGFYTCFNWEWQMVYWYYPYDANTDFRGNITAVTRYPDANSTSNTIVQSRAYDIAGNVLTAQVDCCQQQTWTYTDTYEYAYPSSVTDGNPSGLYLTRSTSYDFNTGLVGTTTDENTQATSHYYNGDTLRTDHIDFPDGGRISYDYGDNLVADSSGKYNFRLTTTQKLDASRSIDSKQYFDGAGALVATFDSYTSTNGWSIRNMQYDSMGRMYRYSNPYFSTSDYGTVAINPDGIWTTKTFDNLSRPTQVDMPRGDDSSPTATNSMQATYEGEVTTFTDAAGKQRRNVKDALGRVIKLHEPNSSGALGAVGTPNQETVYLYDPLDNLVRITQGSQNRYFKFDSMSRLIREKQPEHDANSGYNLSDSLTGNSSWSRKFEYNTTGLLSGAWDARGVSASFTYDGLNRLSHIDYSDSTPDAHYYYDSQTLPSGAPSYTHGSANGRLIALTYGTTTANTGTYFGYDVMGRVNVQKQVTGSNTYGLSYTYNYVGQVTSETYPSNRVVSYSYDNAGRLSTVSDGTTTFASNFGYAPSGAMTSETWGNGAVRSLAYNSALQVSQVKLKQSSSGSELQRYDYLYGQVTQSNGSVDKTKNTGQVARIDGTINGSATKEWDQRFSYDELGRLSAASEYQQGSTQTWKHEYTYDRYGNRFQSGGGNTSNPYYTPVVSSDINDTTNRFITSGSTPVTYDAAGNITQDAKFRFMNATYDANGRQLTASAMDSDLSETSLYDSNGQRVQRTSNSGTRTIVYDTFGRQIADYNGTTMERENIYRSGQLLAVYEAASTCYMTIADFVTAFFNGALHRPPNSTELADWTSKLTKGQAQGHAKLIKVAQDLGAALFTSSEYTNTDYQTYVNDLYHAFLQREGDSGGIANWMAALNQGYSFTHVRNGFAYSLEFQGNVVRLCAETSGGTAPGANLKYVMTDAQGSIRAVMNNGTYGSSSVISRHDYLPFGEEIWAGVGLRTTSQKYSATNNIRGRYGLTERDEATGFDNTLFRKYDSFAGRWTSPDPYRKSMQLGNPQTFNRYAYVQSDPLNFVDPTGLMCWAVFLVTTTRRNGEIISVDTRFLYVYCDPVIRTPIIINQRPTEITGGPQGETRRVDRVYKPPTAEQMEAYNKAQEEKAKKEQRYKDCLRDADKEMEGMMRTADAIERDHVFSVNAIATTVIGALVGGVGGAAESALWRIIVAEAYQIGYRAAIMKVHSKRKADCELIKP